MRLWSIVQFALIGLLVFVGTLLPRKGTHRAVQLQICSLVNQKFFRSDQALENWSKSCQERADEISLWWSRDQFMQHVQYQLDEFAVSHMMVYNPIEDRRLWHGEAVDNGLRLRLIEGRLVVYEVLKNSPAALAEIRPGDELINIDGEVTRSAWAAQNNAGLFQFRRFEKTINVHLQTKPLVVDHAPTLTSLGHEVGRLEISSFRGEYFNQADWLKIANELPKYKKIVVDLRDNSGGNLVAMLRGLSPFFCQSTKVGTLSQPRRSQESGPAPQDDLDEMAQLALLEKYRVVPLYTFTQYGCVTVPVTVLIDGNTASVSEIFAQAMLARAQTQVWGRPSSGDVLLATWYALPLLGFGYSLSIPEAQFLTMSGDSLEGGGVWPQQELSYDLNEALAGQDSWLLRAQIR